MPVRYKGDIEIKEELVERLPEKVCLFATIQYLDQIEDVRKELEEAGVEVETLRAGHGKYEGQLLGCTTEKIGTDADAFLYVGDGFFHPQTLLVRNTKPVYRYNPKTERVKKFTRDDKRVKKFLKRKKSALSAFHREEEIGVLVTTKYGQSRVEESLKLKEKYPGKRFTYLLADTINPSLLEDFPHVECFVNTACPQISISEYQKMPKPVINIRELGMEW